MTERSLVPLGRLGAPRRAGRLLAALAVAGLTLPDLLAPGALASLPRAALPDLDAASQCRAAVAEAQDRHGLPDGLLAAVAATESGRFDALTGTRAPWPWTVTAGGQGRFHATRDLAVAAVAQLQAQGVQSIDVGCLQVNLRHHPNAFATLDEAFDPAANADYAARFLLRLHARAADWMGAAMAYHSLTPEIAAPYGARIAAAWGAAPVPTAPGAWVPRPAMAPAPPVSGPGMFERGMFEPGTAFPVALPAAFRAPVPVPRRSGRPAALRPRRH